MPLPYKDGVILKNLGYFEESTFSVLNGLAPNRGGKIQQQVFVLFYEQRVYIGKNYGSPEGNINTVVHAENGSLLHLVNYDVNDEINNPLTPPSVISQDQPTFPIVKQVSVPHGNSILAVGNFVQSNALPYVPDENTDPVGNVTQSLQKQYDDASNETGGLSKNPNRVLQNFNNDIFNKLGTGPYTILTTQFTVDTSKGQGNLSNLTFESKNASVTKYVTTFWHVQVNSFTIGRSFQYLQYTQRIELQFKTFPGVTFIHVDANTLTKVSS